MPIPEALAATLWTALSDPWTQGTVARGFAEMAIVGVLGGVLGCWIVYYELAYGAESLAHSMFPGMVAAALLGLPLVGGAAIGVLAAALGVAAARRVPQIGSDTAVAVVVTALFGAGVLLALSPNSPPGVQGLLFGDVLGLADGDLVVAAVLAAGALLALRLLHARLLAVGFDRGSARALGASPALVDAALLVLLAAAILVAVQGLGNLLVVAVLVAPAATARLLCGRLARMMGVAAGMAVLAGFAGLYASYYMHTAGGASIAAVLVLMYLLALAGTSMRRRIVRRVEHG